MFDDVKVFFSPTPSPPPVTVELLWSDRRAMELWLKDTLFVEALKLDWNGRKRILDVAPLRLPFSKPYLLSIDFLSLLSHRPAGASVTAQDFQRAFCGAFIDVVALPEPLNDGKFKDVGEGSKLGSFMTHRSVNREEPQDFLRWLSKAMLQCAHGPNGEPRASLTPGLLSELLANEAAKAPVIREKWLSASVETIPLIVSALFALHRQALWPVLREALEDRGLSKLRLHFSIMELFINRWAGDELRYRSVEAEDVVSVFHASADTPYSDPRLDATLDDVLNSLEIKAGREGALSVQSMLGKNDHAVAQVGSVNKSVFFSPAIEPQDITTVYLDIDELREEV